MGLEKYGSKKQDNPQKGSSRYTNLAVIAAGFGKQRLNRSIFEIVTNPRMAEAEEER